MSKIASWSAPVALTLLLAGCADTGPSYRDDWAWRTRGPDVAVYDPEPIYVERPGPYYVAPPPLIASAPRIVRPPDWRRDDGRWRDRRPAQGAPAPPQHWDARAARGPVAHDHGANDHGRRDNYQSRPAAERDRRSAPPSITAASAPQRPNSRPPRNRRDDGHGS